ncbi:MtnX-like HAD-IB family phosphatase [Chloroflexota bacterium]
MSEITKTLVQCDFDGTITEEDISFILLDTFANRDWRRLLRDYQKGKISVGRFNMVAFAMVKANRESLLEVALSTMRIRPGFPQLLDCCRRKGFRFAIVSNGLDFYIEEILRVIGMAEIEVLAAQTSFHPEGLETLYIGPDGNYLNENFKGAYVNSFLEEGYRIIYVGDGTSDISPSKQCHYVFATGELATHYKRLNLNCISFTDFNEVVRVLELW